MICLTIYLLFKKYSRQKRSETVSDLFRRVMILLFDEKFISCGKIQLFSCKYLIKVENPVPSAAIADLKPFNYV